MDSLVPPCRGTLMTETKVRKERIILNTTCAWKTWQNWCLNSSLLIVTKHSISLSSSESSRPNKQAKHHHYIVKASETSSLSNKQKKTINLLKLVAVLSPCWWNWLCVSISTEQQKFWGAPVIWSDRQESNIPNNTGNHLSKQNTTKKHCSAKVKQTITITLIRAAYLTIFPQSNICQRRHMPSTQSNIFQAFCIHCINDSLHIDQEV